MASRVCYAVAHPNGLNYEGKVHPYRGEVWLDPTQEVYPGITLISNLQTRGLISDDPVEAPQSPDPTNVPVVNTRARKNRPTPSAALTVDDTDADGEEDMDGDDSSEPETGETQVSLADFASTSSSSTKPKTVRTATKRSAKKRSRGSRKK